ncbi:mitogen-activated protein kinase kinase kinase 5 isoform X1 [Carica papaya]|uniref:mitogen-activated protein kinase kinase kinase 5 isoform X1 n=1 Tax=Carica papaya TaxID=3649 RepID=UPI000B8CCE5D|nr:mitogen-activated protein kinase kinase kinase 5 isoform X1 [Carica papaya]
MRWLQNISFSSPSSSSSSVSSLSAKHSSSYSPDHFSPSNTPDRRHHHSHRGGGGTGFRFGHRKLTRQRKLRHLSDHDVSAAQMKELSRSTSAYSTTSGSSSAVAMPLPLPLPLPEPEAETLVSSLPSPRDVGLGKGVDDRDRDRNRNRDRDRADGAGDGVLPNSPIARKAAEHSDMKSRVKMHKDQTNMATSGNTYWIDVPTRSAPTSPFSSPVCSPQRKSLNDIFPYHKGGVAPCRNQGWSAPEMPTTDIPGFLSPSFFDYAGISTDNSPIHSPNRSPRLHPGSLSGSSSPMHPRLSIDPSFTLRECTNVHPLPLPPGASLPSTSAPISQAPSKPESLPMNCQWQKGKLIGRGTFGSVYVASNRETGALCAMKEVELLHDDPKSAECIKQLEQEINVLSQLQHPNIVQYYGSGIADDRFYIYLEYVHPGSINKYVRDHCGAMTESIVRNFTRHILSGLAYLHSKKTIHRDIKGANLLVDASGVVKLADFGMSKHLSGQRADLSLKGSPYWMAPELMQAVMQKDNNSDLAFAVDIWSLGCTIIEMFTGKPPWSEYEGAAAMFKVMKDTPPIPESLSPECKDFLRCCFRRNPAERPSAYMLLEHRFLKNSQQPDVSPSSQLLTGTKLMDKTPSPRRQLEFKLDPLPVFPSANKGSADSEIGQRFQYETPDLTLASRYSPRSTLEGLPTSPSPRSAIHTHHLSISASISNNTSCCTRNTHLGR